jgi:hypothetical protein
MQFVTKLYKALKHEVSFFSGQEFTVDAELGLSGTCDFLMSRSREQFEVEAPVVVIVEDYDLGWGDRFLGMEMIARPQTAASAKHSLPIDSPHGSAPTPPPKLPVLNPPILVTPESFGSSHPGLLKTPKPASP